MSEEKKDPKDTQFISVWDVDPIHCPYGHLQSECMQQVKKRKGYYRVCTIRRREQNKEAARRRKLGISKRTVGRPPTGIDVNVEPNPSKVHPTYDGGKELSGTGREALIQLVCGHISVYERSKLTYNSAAPNYDEELFCYTDKDWFHVHKVGAAYTNDEAMVLYPLEVAAKKACFLQSEFFRLKEADKIRSEKKHAFSQGHHAFRRDEDVINRGYIVASLEDLKLTGSNRYDK